MPADTGPDSANRSRWRSRLVLVALFALFFIPIVSALVLNIRQPDWLPFGQVNRGELVDPLVPAGVAGVVALDGTRWATGSEEAHWALVHVGGPRCAQPCTDALIAMRQARLALGKDADRVARWWLVTAMPDARTLGEVGALDPGLHVGRIDPDAAVAASASAHGARVQLVDPSGLLVLRYRDERPASAILKDLKRLLKISKQG